MGFVVVMFGLLGLGVATWVWTGRRTRPLAANASIDWPPGWKNRRLESLARPGTVLITLLVAAGLGAGGWYALLPTWQEVYDRYVDQIDAMERRFYQIAERLPPPGQLSIPDSRHNLNPPPMYDAARGLVNTEFVSAEELANPLHQNHGGIYPSGDLTRYIYWRHSPPHGIDDKASRDMPAEIEAALACRYLVVIRSLSATDHEAFFFDLTSTELLLALRLSSSRNTQAASELLRELTMRTNGTFVGR